MGFHKNKNCDGLMMTTRSLVSIKWCNNVIHFAAIYIHRGSVISVCLDEFTSFYGFLSSLSYLMLICGDFNIYLDTDTSSSLNFTSLLDFCNLVQHIDFPTHTHGHILDCLITPSDFTGIKIHR